MFKLWGLLPGCKSEVGLDGFTIVSTDSDVGQGPHLAGFIQPIYMYIYIYMCTYMHTYDSPARACAFPEVLIEEMYGFREYGEAMKGLEALCFWASQPYKP